MWSAKFVLQPRLKNSVTNCLKLRIAKKIHILCCMASRAGQKGQHGSDVRVWQKISSVMTMISLVLTKCHPALIKISTELTNCQNWVDKISAPGWQIVRFLSALGLTKLSALSRQNCQNWADSSGQSRSFLSQHRVDKIFLSLT